MGIAFGIVFDLLLLIGVFLAGERTRSTLGSWVDMGGLGPGSMVKLLMFGALAVAGLAVAVFASRAVAHKPGVGFGGDLFVAATALLPIGAMAVLGAILGIAVPELTAALTLATLCLLVLILYGGLVSVAGIDEGRATLAVPLILILAGWLMSVFVRGMITNLMF